MADAHLQQNLRQDQPTTSEHQAAAGSRPHEDASATIGRDENHDDAAAATRTATTTTTTTTTIAQPQFDASQRTSHPSDQPDHLTNTLHIPSASLLSNVTGTSTTGGGASDIASASFPHAILGHVRKPSDVGLHLHTDNLEERRISIAQLATDDDVFRPAHNGTARPAPLLPAPHLGHRWHFDPSNSISSPPSSVSSPMLAALGEVTPLPSPLAGSMESLAWRRSGGPISRSRGSSNASLAREDAAGLLIPAFGGGSPQHKKKKSYPPLGITSAGAPMMTAVPTVAESQTSPQHGRERSISEFVPDQLQNVRPRNVTVAIAESMSNDKDIQNEAQQLHRELHHMDRMRPTSVVGHEPPVIPTPPASDSHKSSEPADEEYMEVRRGLVEKFGSDSLSTCDDEVIHHWNALRLLGTGSFSQVVLASGDGQNASRSKQLVAVKIVAHQLEAGSDEKRMEVSIKREIELLQGVSHPSLPRLLAHDDGPRRALLILNYCPGGDLFDLAAQHPEILTHNFIQRVFAELVDAVTYLHENYIVHRDIKLENVLLNLSASNLAAVSPELRTFDQPIVTLGDLGLARKIPKPPASPLLTFPCGSTDYAAPEMLLGQEYDGRATDAWALGVLLYALLEKRLPFDPPPGMRVSGTVKHRIARCDWLWSVYGDRYGDWVEDTPKGREMQGAREVVEGLLKKVSRGRWNMSQVRNHGWVKNGIEVDKGLRPPHGYLKGAARDAG